MKHPTQKSYSPAYREKLVRRMQGANAVSAGTLSRETGVTQSSLSRWLREARGLDMANRREKSRTGRKKSLADKVRIMGAAETLAGPDLGAYLRSEGVYPEELMGWREALGEGSVERSAQRRIRELERDLRRKEKALAEAAALLILKKKAIQFGLLEVEDDDTVETSEN